MKSKFSAKNLTAAAACSLLLSAPVVMGAPLKKDLRAQYGVAAPTPIQIKLSFDGFDTDNSGQISTVELFNTLVLTGVKTTQKQCGNLIKMFDDDRSGQMEFPEFYQLIEESLKKPKKQKG